MRAPTYVCIAPVSTIGFDFFPRRSSKTSKYDISEEDDEDAGSTFASLMFAREGPKIRAKDLLHIPLVPPANTPPPGGGGKKKEQEGEGENDEHSFN